MIAREYSVHDRDMDYIENEDGDTYFTDRSLAEDLALATSQEGGYGPYAVAVRVPGPGGWRELRAVAVYEDGLRTFTTDVYEMEMSS
jgi:hypothetical protein